MNPEPVHEVARATAASLSQQDTVWVTRNSMILGFAGFRQQLSNISGAGDRAYDFGVRRLIAALDETNPPAIDRQECRWRGKRR